MKFSIIVPVFNRPDEVKDLLKSLTQQDYGNFEVILVEDGSSLKCDSVVKNYHEQLDIAYYFKENTGPGDSRNFGASKASGDYLVFFDSDCIIPPQYLQIVKQALSSNPLDAYGGPDRAPKQLNQVQHAINYTMTSLMTTGGIRGHQKAAKSFIPRSFNMGIVKPVFYECGGFSDLHPGEDPELIYRLAKLGCTKGLIAEAYVYHKRRINFSSFARQVYKFGLARTILMKWHKDSRKWVYYLPTLALLTGCFLIILGLFNTWFWYLIGLGLLIIFIDALLSTKSFLASILAIPATIVQITGYGWGFLKGWWNLHVFRRPEKQRFPEMFMGQNRYF